ncbi:glucose-6-phosphate dehydrogenase assembly protein OpcA [Streptomyces sp. KL116D]|uniref:glucose-6-phosphate dehydrogenase assembly protein OpcA n=1 Tax=Streptomyces sp. KL116D TaxID=3045152 RepID=UPI0035562072
MVLTMVIVTDEENAYDATQGRQRGVPRARRARLVVIKRVARSPRDQQGSGSTPRCGSASDAGTGETVILRLYGEVRRHAHSVVLPLLLPDAPGRGLVAGRRPGPSPAKDPLGAARRQRRITDTVRADEDALDAARPARAASYTPGRHRPGLDPAHPVALPCWPPALDQARTRHRLPRPSSPGRDGAELLARWLAPPLPRRRSSVTTDGRRARGSAWARRTARSASAAPDGPLAALSLPTAGPSAPSLKVARPPS